MKRCSYIVFIAIFVLLQCACGQGGSGETSTWQEQYDLGIRYLEDGDYEEAIIAFTAAIEIDPKRAEAYVGRGDAYFGLGETKDNLKAAEKDYEKALDLDETLAEAYLGLADVYIRRGDYDKALDILQEGTEYAKRTRAIKRKIEEVEDHIGDEETPTQGGEAASSNPDDAQNTAGLYPIAYAGMTVNAVAELWGWDYAIADYWYGGGAKPFYYSDWRVPMIFYVLDTEFTGVVRGDQEIIMVDYYLGTDSPMDEVAPGIPTNATYTQLANLSYAGSLSEDVEGDSGETAIYAIKYSPEIMIHFCWYDYHDPRTTEAESISIYYIN